MTTTTTTPAPTGTHRAQMLPLLVEAARRAKLAPEAVTPDTLVWLRYHFAPSKDLAYVWGRHAAYRKTGGTMTERQLRQLARDVVAGLSAPVTP
jgi:hypothetical protein